MLYHLFSYLESTQQFPGAQLFEFISFRAALALIISLLISLVFGGKIVSLLRRKQVGESIRNLGLEGQSQKAGTPTMGGLIILAAILVPTLLCARLDNIYILLMLFVTFWMGVIGFVDDYIKVFKKNKKGLAGKFKIIGQVFVGLVVACVLSFHPDVKIRDYTTVYIYEAEDGRPVGEVVETYPSSGIALEGDGLYIEDENRFLTHDIRSSKTTIPFTKNNEFDYGAILRVFGLGSEWTWLLFIPIVILIITAVSNGANLTDGLDGLATGTSAIIVLTLLVLAYIAGNAILADYLNVMYIPMSGELVIFSAAFVGACIGFLWYNTFPASVFMGDTGSLAIGGIIATLAVIIRKELLIPLLCGIFLIESLSVILQVTWFKYTRLRFGEGRRVFKMAPLHHHYQKMGVPETKIVTRFWIVGIALAAITVITLKVR